MAFLVSSATLLSGNSRVLLSITGISNCKRSFEGSSYDLYDLDSQK